MHPRDTGTDDGAAGGFSCQRADRDCRPDTSQEPGGGSGTAPDALRHQALWNFAHLDLDVPEDVVVENVHLVDSLMQLSYRISHSEEEQA